MPLLKHVTAGAEAIAGLAGGVILISAIGSTLRSSEHPSAYPPRSRIQEWQTNAPLRTDGISTAFVFFDYECPYCAAFDSVLTDVGQSENFRIVLKHLPQPNIHPHAMEAALASICAEAAERGGLYHHLLFERRKDLGEGLWSVLALEAGINNLSAFESCMQSQETRDQIDRDIDLARRLGVTGTPAIFSNGWLVVGALSRDQLVEFVEDAY